MRDGNPNEINYLLTAFISQSNDNDSNIKIADFGFAKKCPRSQCLTTQCGTPGYVAPEILEGTPYDMLHTRPIQDFIMCDTMPERNISFRVCC